MQSAEEKASSESKSGDSKQEDVSGTVKLRNLHDEPDDAAAGDAKSEKPAAAATTAATKAAAVTNGSSGSDDIHFVTEHPMLFGYVHFR